MSEPEELIHQQHHSIGCGIMGRYPIISVVSFAFSGVLTGFLLSRWDPEQEETKTIVLKWLGLVGTLFIRSLKAIVLPMVFVKVSVSVVDMVMIGNALTVGRNAIVLYATTTILGATIGLISILSFRDFIKPQEFQEETMALIQLGCTEPNSLLMENITDGIVSCVPSANASSPYTQFEIVDQTAGIIITSGSKFAELSLSETIYSGVFLKLITDNIFDSLVDGNFASVVVFAGVFGSFLGRLIIKKGMSDTSASYIMPLLREISDVLMKIINWIIACTPFAVFSLISNAIGSKNNLSVAFGNVVYLIVANVCGLIAHFMITDVGFFALASGLNPFEYLRHIIPAQTTALACASSAATLPVTLRCVKNAAIVNDDICNSVCPAGATINMDGTALFFPCACIWLALVNGLTPNIGSYILLLIMSTIGSVGTAPVPSASLVLVITAYNTIFGMSGVPDGFEYIVAIDWFLDRCRTCVNVTGDAVVAAILSVRLEPVPSFKELVLQSNNPNTRI